MMADKVDAPTTHTDSATGQNNLVGTSAKAIIKNVDMSEEMQQESVDIASAALEKYNIEKDIAAQIKKEFDRKHGPTWHVVVGKNFGSYVTHGMSFMTTIIPCREERVETAFFKFCINPPVNVALSSESHSSNWYTDWFLETKHFIYFYVGTLAILIWKS